jgi:hypothetical protein
MGSRGGADAGGLQARQVNVITLKNAAALDMAELLKRVFADEGLEATPDARTNSLVIRADETTLAAAQALIVRLDDLDAGTRPKKE